MKPLLLVLFFSLVSLADSPKLFLLKTYTDDMNVTDWVMSEKLDGVRGIWDGKKLISRSGKVFSPPASFTRGFPSFALDGELWTKRGDFEHVVSIVNSKVLAQRWDELTFNVFEVPDQRGNLFERLRVLKNYLAKEQTPKIRVIKQIRIKSKGEVKVYLNEVLNLGAEGIVIRDPEQGYYTGRRDKALKYKPFLDADCKVIAIIKGKGKFISQMGGIECDFNNKLIKIGSGFTNEQREHPLKIGSMISFKYYGLTGLGNPRFPIFLRVRSDAKMSLIRDNEKDE